jgi:uncharacterized membrane protein
MTIHKMKKFKIIFLLVISLNSLFAGNQIQTTNNNQAQQTIVVKQEKKTKEFSSLHPLVVHFPIVLILLAAIIQISNLFFKKSELSCIVLLLSVIAFIGAFLSSNVFHPHTCKLPNEIQFVLEEHERFAFYTLWLTGLSTVFSILNYFLFKRKRWSEIILTLLLVFSSISISFAGHYGATLVHIHDVGPKGNYIDQSEHHH